jgi:5-methyltetrahydrofolate--homocysteine methyltransferase
MGTQLQQAGLEPGGCGEAWNVDHPERILSIQQAYVEAGCDLLTTNTFGASRIMLERHGEAERLAEIHRAAVALARQAFGERHGFVVGDIGPFGGLLEPYGEVPPDHVEAAFAEQAGLLVEAGVDAIVIETQTALEELVIGIRAARAAGAACVIGSVAFDRTQDGEDLRTMMGIAPEQAAEFMTQQGVDIVALNCGTGIDMSQAKTVVRRYREATPLPIMVQPNAGQPVLENLQVLYKQTPEEMASALPEVLQAGARIVGGCCGTTPAHIGRFRALLDAQGEPS